MHGTARGHLALIGATLFWGTHYVIGAYALDNFSPIMLTALRWALAAVPLVLLAHFVERPDWRAVLSQWRLLIVLAALGMAGYNLLLYAALLHTNPIGAALVNAANPALIVLLAVLLTNERLTRRGSLGALVSFVGVVVVISGGSWATLTQLEFNIGQLIMVGAITVWSLYTILSRRITSSPIAATAVQAVLVALVLAPLAAVLGGPVPTEGPAIGLLLLIAVLPSVGSYLLWNLALRDISPSIAGLYLNLITVWAVALSIPLGHGFEIADVLGGLIVIVGVLIATWPRKAPHSPQPSIRSG